MLPPELGKLDQLRSLRLQQNPLRDPPLSLIKVLALLSRLQTTSIEAADGIMAINLSSFLRIHGGEAFPDDPSCGLYLCASCGELDFRTEDAHSRLRHRRIMELPRFMQCREWLRGELQEQAKCTACDPDGYGMYRLGERTACGCQMHWDCRKNFTIHERRIGGWESDDEGGGEDSDAS
jgi:hypothetical protein